MEILAHRGWWSDPSEKNSIHAFRRAFAARFGVETDIRDQRGDLVISHDPPGVSALEFDAFLEAYLEIPSRSLLALNIKSDGLAALLDEKLKEYGITNYFVFDMSVPDSIHYLNREMPVYIRRSEYEGPSTLDGLATGYWLDSFSGQLDNGLVSNAKQANKRTALVSPELHQRDHRIVWRHWRSQLPQDSSGLALCTDFPDQADAYFSTGEFHSERRG